MNPRIKSKESLEKVYVRFVNKTTRDVDINWLDYEGIEVKYRTLEPDHYVDIDTFTDHPWVFDDHKTRDKLNVNNELYFFPPSWKEIFRSRFPNASHSLPPHRIIVMITLPVYSLRERCLQVVRDSVDLYHDDRDVINELEHQLPKSLVDELMKKWLLKRDGIC